MLTGDKVLEFYREALSFMALAEQIGPNALFDVTVYPSAASRGQKPRSTLCLRIVVHAPRLLARHAAARATVLFSGTLSPAQYYRDMLGLPACTAWLEVQGPFRAEQLAVQLADHVFTRYRDRESSLMPIAEIVARQLSQ